ncbi:hypothetical protein HK405_016084, partial [Cladochytrium tenue]
IRRNLSAEVGLDPELQRAWQWLLTQERLAASSSSIGGGSSGSRVAFAGVRAILLDGVGAVHPPVPSRLSSSSSASTASTAGSALSSSSASAVSAALAGTAAAEGLPAFTDERRRIARRSLGAEFDDAVDLDEVLRTCVFQLVRRDKGDGIDVVTLVGYP